MLKLLKVVLLAGVGAFLLAQPTKIKESQVLAPTASVATVRILAPTGGWQQATVSAPLVLSQSGGLWSLACPSCIVGPVIFVDHEIPAGVIDGVNAAFTLANVPAPVGSLSLFRNGLLQKAGFDFNLSGLTVTFVAAAVPSAGDTLEASYRR